MNIENTSHNTALGSLGEDVIEKKLVDNGFFILERNIKIGYSEIDLIAKKGEKVRFVEVKTRMENSLSVEAEYSITRKKLRSLKRGIIRYSLKNKIRFNDIHLDLAIVIFDRSDKIKEIKYYQDIF